MPKILAAAGRTIYDHPGNVDSKVGVDIGASLGRLGNTASTDFGEGQINLGLVKSGEIYEGIEMDR